MTDVQWIDRGDGVRLACRILPGEGPCLVFLPGYMSDMEGSKALALEAEAARRGWAYLRFDYSGCGISEGDFAKGSIGRWTEDALAVIAAQAPGRRLILIGSSMGGWIMLHVALALKERVSGLVGIAAAPDFTRWGLAIDDGDRLSLAEKGYVERPSLYGDQPYRYWRALTEDAERRLLLDSDIAVACPVRLLQGQADPDVPWQTALRIAERLHSDDVQTLLIKDGDHRLSRPQDIGLLFRVIGDLA